MFDIIFDKNKVVCLSNVYTEYADIAKQAAVETAHDIFIDYVALDIDGKVVKGCVAIKTEENKDFGDFWKRFRELKEQKK